MIEVERAEWTKIKIKSSFLPNDYQLVIEKEPSLYGSDNLLAIRTITDGMKTQRFTVTTDDFIKLAEVLKEGR